MDCLTQLKRSKLLHLCIAISFFTSGLIINVVQLILFVFLKPFNKTLYRKINYYLCYSFFCQLTFLPDWWSNSKLYVYAEDDVLEKYVGTEHVLLMMNHTYEIDWLIGWVFCEKYGVLGNCKAYAKKVIKFIPVIGWAWYFAEFVFLERSYDKDKEIIVKQLRNIFENPYPAWLLLNAEGTRFTKQKHEASTKFAMERGMVVLKHHLIPRTKGFVTSVPILKKMCPVILDIQITFNKNDPVEPTISNLLNGRSITGYMHVRRIPLEEVPDNEEEAANWLQNLFVEKDKIQDSFYTHGDFFTGTGMPKVKGRLQKRRLSTLLNTIGWLFLTLTPILYYLGQLLLSGRLLNFSIGIGILTAFYILLQKSIGMSKISKASTYGSETTKTD